MKIRNRVMGDKITCIFNSISTIGRRIRNWTPFVGTEFKLQCSQELTIGLYNGLVDSSPLSYILLKIHFNIILTSTCRWRKWIILYNEGWKKVSRFICNLSFLLLFISSPQHPVLILFPWSNRSISAAVTNWLHTVESLLKTASHPETQEVIFILRNFKVHCSACKNLATVRIQTN